MNTFVEKNKNWLKFYSIGSRILGWFMILFALISFLLLIRTSLTISWKVLEQRRILLLSLGTTIEKIFVWLPESIILLGVGQLIKYICEHELKMPWLLRNGTKILYLFAVLIFLRPFIFYFYQNVVMNVHPQVKVISSICFLFANVLILIGLGNILKRILPIIEEHKSLV